MERHANFLPLDSGRTAFLGLVGGDVVRLDTPDFPKVGRNFRVRFDYEEIDVSAFNPGDDVEDCLKSLVTSLTGGGGGGCDGKKEYNPDRVLAVMRQIRRIPNSRLRDVSDDCQAVTLAAPSGEELEVHFPPEFPHGGRDSRMEVSATSPDLPDRIVEVTSSDPSDDVLENIYSVFMEHLELLEPIRRTLEELDAQAWVIDPERPTGKDLHRRIVLSKEVHLQIALDPAAPATDLPDFKFLGPDSKVEPLRQKLVDNQLMFSSNRSLARNVELMFGLELPQREEVAAEDEFNLDCCICYSERLGDALPSKVCDNAKCGQRFHEQCLATWLNSLTENRVNFDIIAGNCPMCEGPISCKAKFT